MWKKCTSPSSQSIGNNALQFCKFIVSFQSDFIERLQFLVQLPMQWGQLWYFALDSCKDCPFWGRIPQAEGNHNDIGAYSVEDQVGWERSQKGNKSLQEENWERGIRHTTAMPCYLWGGHCYWARAALSDHCSGWIILRRLRLKLYYSTSLPTDLELK